MTRTDIIISILCLVFGYWLVASLMDIRAKKDGSSARDWSRSTPGGKQDAGTDSWYRVLGVKESAPWDEIVAAYRSLIAQYHPDKVARLGEEIRAVAESKSKQINTAYETAMRLRR